MMGRGSQLLALLKQVCQTMWPLFREQIEEFAKEVAMEVAKELATEAGKKGLQKLLGTAPATPNSNRSAVRVTAPLPFDPLAGAVLRSKQVMKKASELTSIISGKAPKVVFHMAPAPTTTAVANIIKSQEVLRAGHKAPGINADALSMFAAEPSALVEKVLGDEIPAPATIGALVEKVLGDKAPAPATIGTLVDALGDEIPAPATIGALVEKVLGDKAPAPATIGTLVDALGDEIPAPATIDALVEKLLGDKAPAPATIGTLVDALGDEVSAKATIDALGTVIGDKVPAQATIGALQTVLGHKAPAPAPAPTLEEKGTDNSRVVLYFMLACNGVLLTVVAYKVWRKYWGGGGGGQAGAAAAPQAAAATTVDPKPEAAVEGEATASTSEEAAVVDPAAGTGEGPQEAAGDGNGAVDNDASTNE